MALKDGIVTNHVRKNVITVTRRPGNVLEPVTRDIMETSANITIEVFLLLQSFIFLFMIACNIHRIWFHVCYTLTHRIKWRKDQYINSIVLKQFLFKTILIYLYKLLLGNMALQKPTFQSSQFFISTESKKAVDGQRADLNLYSGQCAVTAEHQNYALWRVDLLQKRKIERLTVYALTSSSIWG